MSRIVSAEEARRVGDELVRVYADTGMTRCDRERVDLAHTVVQQAEQIAGVLALHTPQGSGVQGCTQDGHDWPCPTARALGVTA